MLRGALVLGRATTALVLFRATTTITVSLPTIPVSGGPTTIVSGGSLALGSIKNGLEGAGDEKAAGAR